MLDEDISLFFKWKDALYLPSIKCYHKPSFEEQDNIINFAHKMDNIIQMYCDKLRIDVFLVNPVVHCWIRPLSVNPMTIQDQRPPKKCFGFNYNKHIGSKSTKSAHIFGRAIDWHLDGYDCNKIRKLQLPYLKEFDLRCEDITGNWIHNDDYPVKYKRFFKP